MFACCCADPGEGAPCAIQVVEQFSSKRACREPSLRRRQFTVTLSREDEAEHLGMVLELSCFAKMFIVQADDVGQTPVGRHNWSAHREIKICTGDYIVAVNEKTGMEEMKGALQEREFTVCVQRAEMHVVSVGEWLAMRFEFDDSSTCLIVSDVNDKRGASSEIFPGDRILAVNGRQGSPAALLHELRAGGQHQVTISRCE